MKQVVVLLMIASSLAAQLKAMDIVLVVYNHRKPLVMELKDDETVANLKLAIEAKTGIPVEDQRLSSYNFEPIINQTLISQIKTVDLGELYIVVGEPLGTNGIVTIRSTVENVHFEKVHASGSETLGEFKKRICKQYPAGKLWYFTLELTDDSKTLDEYQIYQNLTLDMGK